MSLSLIKYQLRIPISFFRSSSFFFPYDQIRQDPRSACNLKCYSVSISFPVSLFNILPMEIDGGVGQLINEGPYGSRFSKNTKAMTASGVEIVEIQDIDLMATNLYNKLYQRVKAIRNWRLTLLLLIPVP